MKKIFLLLLLATFSVGIYAKEQPNTALPREPFFKNNVIKLLDGAKMGGASMGFDGPTIYDMLWFGQKINELQRGRRNPHTNLYEKKVIFHGEPHTIQELVLVEEQLNGDFEQKRTHLISHKQQPLSDSDLKDLEQQLASLEHDYLLHHEELKSSLNKVKKEFLDLSNGFMQQVFFLHQLVAQLTDEWCERHERPESFLKTLSHVETNNFNAFMDQLNHRFDEHMKTFKSFDVFLGELKGFLLDLVYSCPKAYKEFIENKDKYAQKK